MSLLKKHSIEVRRAVLNTSGVKAYEVVEVIQRVLRAEQCGNFNPVFCLYKNQRQLVESDAGDLSDPFRRDESYLKTLYITLKSL